jgi:hypothetical protein
MTVLDEKLPWMNESLTAIHAEIVTLNKTVEGLKKTGTWMHDGMKIVHFGTEVVRYFCPLRPGGSNGL